MLCCVCLCPSLSVWGTKERSTYVYMCVCGWVHIHVLDVKYLCFIPLGQLISLNLKQAVSVRLTCQISDACLHTPVLGFQAHLAVHSLYLGAGDSNSGPYACTASVLIHWSISPALFCSFYLVEWGPYNIQLATYFFQWRIPSRLVWTELFFSSFPSPFFFSLLSLSPSLPLPPPLKKAERIMGSWKLAGLCN